jgi:hypothetical protein
MSKESCKTALVAATKKLCYYECRDQALAETDKCVENPTATICAVEGYDNFILNCITENEAAGTCGQASIPLDIGL